MSDIAARTSGQVARPLAVLVPLIKKDLEEAHEASERASMPYYRSAGEKMIEAKGQLKHGEFTPWLERNFKIGERQARFYMNYAKIDETGIAIQFSSLRNFVRQTSSPNHGSAAPWRSDIKESIDQAKREAERVRSEHLTRQQELQAERELAMRLIDIGFKILAKELHPDRGGSREAMTRLNRVRNRLKEYA